MALATIRQAFAKREAPVQVNRDGPWPDDTPLMRLTPRPEDAWTIRDSFTGTLVLGKTGSGKTSGPGGAIARAFLRAGYGGMVLCAMAGEADLWRALLRETGREQDGVFIHPNNPWRFNFLDAEAYRNGEGLDHLDDLVNLLIDIASVQKGDGKSSDAAFWVPQKRLLIRNCFSLLLLAKQPLTLAAVNGLMRSSPENAQQAKSDAWQRGSYLFRVMGEARRVNGAHREFEHIENYWLKVRPEMPDRTRATIDMDFLGMTDGPLSRGKLGDLFGTSTNASPSDCFRGKVIVVDVPVSEYRTDAVYAAMIMETSFYRATLRRLWNPALRPVFLWSDEAQSYANEFDADYHAICRKYGVAVVRMTQNIPVWLKAFGGTPQAQHQVDGILGNLGFAWLCQNTCNVTNTWASKMIARDVVYRASVSRSGQRDASTTLSEAYEDSAPAEVFLGLKNGGRNNGFVVEAVLFAGGRLFDRKHRWLIRKFRQDVK
jgi:hypothetical protein